MFDLDFSISCRRINAKEAEAQALHAVRAAFQLKDGKPRARRRPRRSRTAQIHNLHAVAVHARGGQKVFYGARMARENPQRTFGGEASEDGVVPGGKLAKIVNRLERLARSAELVQGGGLCVRR